MKNFKVKLVGVDCDKDLAVLKVEASEDLLRPINVGESSILRVGQQCLAIGNQFGFDHTLTVGVISGLNREIFSKTEVTIEGVFRQTQQSTRVTVWYITKRFQGTSALSTFFKVLTTCSDEEDQELSTLILWKSAGGDIQNFCDSGGSDGRRISWVGTRMVREGLSANVKCHGIHREKTFQLDLNVPIGLDCDKCEEKTTIYLNLNLKNSQTCCAFLFIH